MWMLKQRGGRMYQRRRLAFRGFSQTRSLYDILQKRIELMFAARQRCIPAPHVPYATGGKHRCREVGRSI